MSKTIPIEPDRTYHIYNRGVNRCKIFAKKSNYFRFTEKMFQYLPSFCTTIAWCFMSNHYHIMIKTKTKQALIKSNFIKKEDSEDDVIELIKQSYSNMLNGYVRYFNLQQSRSGPLFDSRIKKVPVITQEQFEYLIIYIHNNPVHHGYTNSPGEYRWSSYNYYINYWKSRPFHKEVVSNFGGIDAFIDAHKRNIKKRIIDPCNDIL